MSSFLVYNNIVLSVTQLMGFSRVPVYDGPTWLYDHVYIHVRAHYNPNVVSYVPNPAYAPYVVPLAQDGSLPVITDNAIRFELRQPRQLLLYVVGGVVLVQSPGFQPDRKTLYPCDAKGGPIPKVHDIVEHIGRKTFAVDFAVETYMNESWNEMVVAPVVLSHRWTRRQMIDENFYTTIITHGHAIFRADVLSVFQKNSGGSASGQQFYPDRTPTTAALPDDFRQWLFHAVPNGMKRMRAEITPSEDGMSIEYMLIDRQVNVIFPKGITHVELTQNISTDIGYGVSGGAKLIKSVFDAARELVGGEEKKDKPRVQNKPRR